MFVPVDGVIHYHKISCTSVILGKNFMPSIKDGHIFSITCNSSFSLEGAGLVP